MATMTHLNRVRRKRSVKRNLRYLLIFLAMAVGVAACVLGVQMVWQSSWVEKAAMQIASIGNGGGYPVTLEGKTVRQMQAFGPDLAVLTDTTFQVHNSSAKVIQNTQHHLSNPQARYSSVRALLYERGGKKAAVYSSKRVLHEKSFDNAIFTGAISDSGTWAVATQGTRDVALVYVYNKAGDELFIWHSQERVADVALSPDGKTLAVTTLVAQDGILNTNVWLFDVGSKKQTKTITLADQMVVGTHFLNNSEFFAVTDRQSSVITKNGVVKYQYGYSGQTLSGYSFGQGKYLAVVLGDYENFKESTLLILDSKCEEVGKASIESQILDLYAGDKVTVLTQDGILEYSFTGELLREHEASNTGLLVTQVKGQAYLCTPTGIEKVKLKGAASSSSSESGSSQEPSEASREASSSQ